MDRKDAICGVQEAGQAAGAMKDSSEATDANHKNAERAVEAIDSDVKTAAGNASEPEVSTTLTEGDDEDEGSDGRQIIKHGGNTGIEFVYDLEQDDPCDSSSDVDYGTTHAGHQRDVMSTMFNPFRHSDEQPTNHDNQEADSSAKPTLRVRFRSRVRITSGLRRKQSNTLSVDSSPSSSISAPLRYSHGESDSPHSEVNARKYSFYGDFAKKKMQTNMRPRDNTSTTTTQVAKSNRIRGGNAMEDQEVPPDERTALSSSAGWRRGYISSLMRNDFEDSSDDDGPLDDDGGFTRAMLRRRAYTNRKNVPSRRSEELMYGKWPWRLFNRHWWWSKLEPIFCCCNASDSDSDEGG